MRYESAEACWVGRRQEQYEPNPPPPHSGSWGDVSSIFHFCRGMWNSKHYVGPNFYQYDQWKVNDRFFLSGKHFPRSREHEILGPLSIIGIWKNDQKSIVDELAWSPGSLTEVSRARWCSDWLILAKHSAIVLFEDVFSILQTFTEYSYMLKMLFGFKLWFVVRKILVNTYTALTFLHTCVDCFHFLFTRHGS